MENYTFYPGQKVVCVADRGIKYGTHLTKVKVYTVSAVRMGCCEVELDVGMPIGDHILCCSVCGREHYSPIRWRRASRFRPIDTLTEQVERIEKEGAPTEVPVEPEPQTA